jgi:crotonobetainyl-CoA:carnitine CoA-transferase CaiB-like acyl-CoA transferase
MLSALSHLTVLDLSRVLAGPWAGQTLADLGATVIKVEKPGSGDDTRSWGPPFLRSDIDADAAESAYFLAANRGKKSVTIDITQPQGQDLVRRLAARSDVVLENYKVGGLAKYGLDYAALKAVNPALIYCSITGFGQTGPYRDRAGYDFMIQAMGGLMSLTGETDSRPGGGPQKVGVALADIMTGLYATIGVLAALAHRDRTGEGQYIDLGLLDVQVATLANQAMNWLVSGKPPVRLGNAHPNIVPYQSFATRDGHMILAIGNDGQFARFCQVAGRPDLAANALFATNRVRVENREALIAILTPLLTERTTDDWIALLEPVAVPCGPINTLDRVFRDPQVQSRGMSFTLPHDRLGSVPQVANPLKLSATPITYQSAPPGLGQHTDEVMAELLGLGEEEIARLRAEGVV